MNENLKIMVDKLRKIPNCEGIIYAGSRLEGDFIESSDYDFTILISQGKSYYKIFTYKDFIIDICCATEKVIKEQDISNNKVSNPELGIIANGVILFDKKGKMLDIQKQAKKVWKNGPKKNNQKDLQEITHLLTLFLHKLSKKDAENAYTFSSEVINKTVKIFFQLHSVWQPKPFNIEDSIKVIDETFFNLCKELNNSIGKNKIELMKKMILYLIDKFSLEKSFDFYCIKSEN